LSFIIIIIITELVRGGFSLQQPTDPPDCCQMGTAIKHPVPDRVKLSFCTFGVPRCQKSQMKT